MVQMVSPHIAIAQMLSAITLVTEGILIGAGECEYLVGQILRVWKSMRLVFELPVY
mgnify:CR=1 FL=1